MIKIKKSSFLILLFLILGIFFSGCSKQNSNLRTVSIEIFKKTIDEDNKIIILDVRTLQEFNNGHIDGAININFYGGNFYNELSKLDKNKTYLIYCRSGVRSYKTLQLMYELNFKVVLDLDGGILAWENKNYELVK